MCFAVFIVIGVSVFFSRRGVRDGGRGRVGVFASSERFEAGGERELGGSWLV